MNFIELQVGMMLGETGEAQVSCKIDKNSLLKC